MSNQPTPPTFRVLVFELWDNGKIICPAFPPIHTDQLISTQELKQIRDYVDLMIANPQNFHIVRPEPKLTSSRIAELMAPNKIHCKVCNKPLNYIDVTNTERANKLCFDCEKKGILAATDNFKPTCKVCENPATKKHVSGDFLCDKCFEIKIKAKKNSIQRGRNDTQELIVCDQCGLNFTDIASAEAHNCQTIS